MIFRLHYVIFFLNVLGNAIAIDPFSRELIKEECIEERPITGCKETLMEAYAKSGFANSDETTNMPDTRLYLFTRRNKDKAEFLHKCGERLPANTNYRPKCKTITVVHGYIGSICEFAALREIKDQLLYKGNYNVILVDWSWGNRPDYYESCKHARTVAKHIAFFIQMIMNRTDVSAKKFHLVGQSLGGQIVASVGQHIQRFAGQKVRRITALDPALPGFNVDNIDERLDPSDAIYVDVIHTNAGACLPDFGDYRAVGHADFYPNGGSVQLSCLPNILESLLKGDIGYGLGSLLPTVCFHAHSFQYFKTSINACDCQFIGVECDSYEEFESGKCRGCGEDGSKCAVMGMDSENYPRRNGTHKYYLDTTLFCPYCSNECIDLQGFPEKPTKGHCKSSCFLPSPVV